MRAVDKRVMHTLILTVLDYCPHQIVLLSFSIFRPYSECVCVCVHLASVPSAITLSQDNLALC